MESLPRLFKDCPFTRAIRFGVLGHRSDSLNWCSGQDIIFFLLQHASNGNTTLVPRWLLMAEMIWKQRNCCVFNGDSPSTDELIIRIIATSDAYACNLGLLIHQTPSYAMVSVASALFTFPDHRVLTIDAGFDCCTSAFHWAVVSWSAHNLPTLILAGTGNALNPLHADLLGLCYLIQHLAPKPNSKTVILMDCLALILYLVEGDNCYINSPLSFLFVTMLKT